MRVDAGLSGVVGQGRSLNSNPGRSHNCYIEIAGTGEPRLVCRPGQKLAFTLPNSPVRGCYSDTGTSYWVAGNGVYKRAPGNAIKLLGNIATNNGTVNLDSNGQQIGLVDGDKGYYITIATDAFIQITDPNFPSRPVNIKVLSGYWIVTVKDSQQFFYKLSSATSWNGLDYATAEGKPDNVISQIILNDELYLIGYKTVEVHNITGNGASPIQRNRNVVIDHGCIAPNSPAKAMDSIYWLGGDDLGQGIVWRLSGYQVERISIHEIEQQIARMAYIQDAFAIAYQMDGHHFYVLQFPSAGKTLYYNITTGLWGTFSYKDMLTGDENIWKASCHCFTGSLNLVGDTVSGKVFALDMDTYSDDGNEIVFERVGTVSKETQSNLFYSEVLIDMETGVGNDQTPDPKAGLAWSDDAGHTWSNWRYSSIGKVGQYGYGVHYPMLGMGRNRAFKLRITDSVKRVIMGSVVNVEKGSP
jgi:hypothetical protein